MRRAIALAVVFSLAVPPAEAQISIFNLRNSLVQFALEQISTEDLTITAADVIEPEEGGTQLVDVRVSDTEGVWLEIDRATLRWNAKRILLAELVISTLSAEGVRVLRQPVAGQVEVKEDADIAETDDEPFDWPRAPITTRIEEMRLSGVEIAEGVIGPSVAFDASGSARDEGDIQALSLEVVRTDAVEGRIKLDYARDFDIGTLTVDLDADEAPGGLVATFAGFPEDSASRISLEANGPLANWGVILDASADRVFEATGQAEIEFQDRIAALADFSVVPLAEMEPRLARVLGEEARLTVDVAEEDSGLVRVRDAELSSPALSLVARGSYSRPSGEMDLGVGIDGRSELAGLAEGVSFDGFGFDGRVQGTLDALEADGTLTLAGLATDPVDVASAELVTAVTVEGSDIGFDLEGGTQGLRLDRLAPETLGPTELDVAGRMAGERLTLDRLTLANALLSLEASGTLGEGGNDAAIAYRFEADDFAPIADSYEVSADGRLSLDGRVSGALAAPRVTGQVRADELVYEGEGYGRVVVDHDVALGDAIEGTVDLSASGSPYGPATVESRFALLGEVVDLRRLRAEALGATLEGRLVFDQRSQLANGQVSLEAPDLAPLSALSGTDARGRLSAEVALEAVAGVQTARIDATARGIDAFEARLARLDFEGTVEDALGSPTVDAVIDAGGLGYQDATLARLSGEVKGSDLMGEGEASFDLTAEGAEGFDALLERARLSGTVSEPQTLGGLDVRLDAEGLGYQDARLASLSGTVEGADVLGSGRVVFDLTAEGGAGGDAALDTARLSGTVEAPQTLASVDAAIDVSGVAFQDARLGSLSGTVQGTDVLSGGTVTAALEAEGAEGFGARLGGLDLDATVTDVQTLARVEAEIAASALAVAGVSADRLTTTLSATDALSPVPGAEIDLTLAGIGGPVNAREATVSARLAEPANAPGTASLDAKARVSPIAAGEAKVSGLTLDARVGDALGADPAIDATLSTGAVSAPGASIQPVRLTARGALSALAVALRAEGMVGEGRTAEEVALALDATLDAVAAAPTVRLTRLDADYGEEALSLNAPATLVAGDTTTVRDVDIALPGGRLAGDATLYGNGLAADLALEMDDLGIVGRFGGPEVRSGRLALEADLDTRPSAASGDLTLALSDFRAEGIDTGAEALALDATGDWAGGRFQTEAQVSGPFGDPLVAQVSLPLRATGGPLPEVPPSGPLEGNVRWNGEVGRIWVLVPLADHILTGPLDLDIEVDGTVSEPQIGGSVAMEGGRYENLETGTILTDLAIESGLSSLGDLTVTATARDGANGTLQVDVALEGDQLEADIASDDAVLVRRDDVKAAMTLDLAAAGPLVGPDISGTITIDRAEIRLVNSLPPSVATLGDVRIKGEPVPEEEPPAGGEIALDIAVRGPRDIYIRGRGLDSEWQVNLDVTGSASSPRVVGTVEPVRGHLDLVGTRFDLVDSAIRFTGGREIDPTLDVRLQAEKNGITGGIEVTGNASVPEIGFFSSPTLAEGEILPRLLYGKTSQSLSAAQAIQLATGIATLTDGSDGTLGRLRGATGLDVIDFETEEGGETSVTVGKNLTDEVFVGAKQSIDGAETEVLVEVEVFEDVTVDAEIGAEGETSVGVNWSKDF